MTGADLVVLLDSFKRLMTQEVIPEIVAAVNERQRAAAATRDEVIAPQQEQPNEVIRRERRAIALARLSELTTWALRSYEGDVSSEENILAASRTVSLEISEFEHAANVAERMLKHEGLEHSEAQARILQLEADLQRIFRAAEATTVDEVVNELETQS